MSVPARLVAAFGALTLLLALFVAGPASAAPYTLAASIAVSESSPCHGAAVTVTGSGFTPGETVVLTIGNTVLGRTTADADGEITLRISVPDALRGEQTIRGVGSTSTRSATTLVTVRACDTDTTAPGGAGAGADGGSRGDGAAADGDTQGGLPDTGVAVLGLLALAVAFVAAGSVLLVGGRRRRSRAARTA